MNQEQKNLPKGNNLNMTTTKETSIDKFEPKIEKSDSHNKETNDLKSQNSLDIEMKSLNEEDINNKSQQNDTSIFIDDKCEIINERIFNDVFSWTNNSERNESSRDEEKNRFFIKKAENVVKNEEQYQKNRLNQKRQKKDSKENKNVRSKHDYLIKSFLSNSINKYVFKKINKLFKKNKLGKMYKCSYVKIIKPNERHLSVLLEKSVKEIFSKYDEKASKECENQKSNKKLFEYIYNNVNLLEDGKEIVNLLDSTYEDQLKLYYESKEIEKFKTKDLKYGTPADYDKDFYNERNRKYYLLENYGFIKYAKSKPYCHNERQKK